MEHSFKLRQGGQIVAEVFGTDRQRCFREIMHYALVYGQDGSCTVEGVEPTDWEEWTQPLVDPTPALSAEGD